MSDGLTTPRILYEYFGRINHIENSGWGVDFPLMMISQLTCEKCLCFMNLRLAEPIS